jgi:hypothetical protein
MSVHPDRSKNIELLTNVIRERVGSQHVDFVLDFHLRVNNYPGNIYFDGLPDWETRRTAIVESLERDIDEYFRCFPDSVSQEKVRKQIEYLKHVKPNRFL